MPGKNIEIYSTENKGRFLITEKFVRNFIWSHKYMTTNGRNVFVYKSDDTQTFHINTCHCFLSS